MACILLGGGGSLKREHILDVMHDVYFLYKWYRTVHITLQSAFLTQNSDLDI